MSHRDLNKSNPTSLARLLELNDKSTVVWQPEELQAILQHQLNASLAYDLVQENPPALATLAAVATELINPPRTFRDLFQHPHPPPALLRFTKEFAKKNSSDHGGALPGEIARVLYYAAILLAKQRCGQRLSQLSDEAVRQGAQWCAQQPWLDQSLRTIFTAALP